MLSASAAVLLAFPMQDLTALSWPTWGQDVTKMSSLEPKIGKARFLDHLGGFLLDLGAILIKPAKIKKTTTVQHF